MPYKLQSIAGGYIVVNSKTGRAHSKQPLSRTRAVRQMRALYAAEGSTKAEAPAEGSGPGGKPLSRSEAARHASLVRWGKESPFAARLAAIREKRKARKGKAKGKGKGAKPAVTPEQRMAEQIAAAAQARAETFSAMGLPEDAVGALTDLAAGTATDDDGGLVKLGLAEQGEDGTLRLTPEGRAVYNAAGRGDLGQAKDAASRGRDRVAKGAERDKAKAEREKEKAERKKEKGGGKEKKEKPKPKAEQEDDDPEQATRAAAAEVGISDDEVAFLRGAADGELPPGSFDASQLMKLGLVADDGDDTVATAEGVDALDALERGDVRGYRRAVRKAGARMRREARQQQAGAEKQKQTDARNRAREQEKEGRTKEEAQRRTQRQADQRQRESARAERTRQRQAEKDGTTAARRQAETEAEVQRILEARRRASKAQTASERAMFANMGGGGSGGGGGGKPTGGQGGLWKKGPDGKRKPQAGMEGGAQAAATPKPKSETGNAGATPGDRISNATRRAGMPVAALPFNTSTANEYHGGRDAVIDKLATLPTADLRALRNDIRTHNTPTGNYITKGDRRLAKETIDYQQALIDAAIQRAPKPKVPISGDQGAEARARISKLEQQKDKIKIKADKVRARKQRLAELESEVRGGGVSLARLKEIRGELAKLRSAKSVDDAVLEQSAILAEITELYHEEDISMSDLNPILDDLEAVYTEALEVADLAEVKAGRRNSTSDQATIDQGYELAMQLCDLFEALGADVDEGEGEPAPDDEAMEMKAETWIGDAIKALDDDTVIGPAVWLNGTPDTPDISHMRDYFTKSTDFWLDAWERRPMLWHHNMDESDLLETMRKEGASADEVKAMQEALEYLEDHPVIGTWTKATVDPIAVWLKGQTNKAHRYRGAIKQMIDRGLIRISTDSAPHLVRRVRQSNGTHEIKRWPIFAASLTTTAAEPRLLDVQAVKSLYGAAGIALPFAIDDNPEATDEARERLDAAKASDDRARRLLLRTRLLSLQE